MPRRSRDQAADSKMLTPTQLSERWGVHRETLTNWRGAGKGPAYVKFGRGQHARVRYSMVDVVDYERAHRIQPRARA